MAELVEASPRYQQTVAAQAGSDRAVRESQERLAKLSPEDAAVEARLAAIEEARQRDLAVGAQQEQALEFALDRS